MHTRLHPYLALVMLLAMGSVAVVAPLVASQVTEAANGVRIHSIEPSCAIPGDHVTLRATGLGAHNVEIAVGGVPAELLPHDRGDTEGGERGRQDNTPGPTGHSVTFIAPSGVALGPTQVTATNPGGRVGSIDYTVCDLPVPDAWAGLWEVTIEARNSGTSQLLEITEITESLSPDTLLGAASIQRFGNCSGTVTENGFDIQCSAEVVSNGCRVSAAMDLAGVVEDDSLTASGHWEAIFGGLCGPLFSDRSRTMELSGVRLSNGQETGPASSLLELFLPFPFVLLSSEAEAGGDS